MTTPTALRRVRSAPDVHVVAGAVPVGPVVPGAGPVDAGGTPTHVWYVSYGSNLLRERFEVYLLGGRVPGLDLDYPGGHGTSLAEDERAVVLPGRLRFALDAPAWGGGGVAFWDPAAEGPGVLARAWRVRLGQFREVVHLENGGLDRQPAPWPADVLTTGDVTTGPDWYGRLLSPGHLDGDPLLTFTHPDPASLGTAVPSDAYRGVVQRGVVETFGPPGRGGLGPGDAAAYVDAALAS